MPPLASLMISPPVELLTTKPHLFRLAQQLSEGYHSHQVTQAELKTIGLALWQVLNLDADSIPPALMIECHHNAIDHLPWECLYHPERGFLGLQSDYTLSRWVRGNHHRTHPLPGPLKILLFTAQPEKTSYQSTPLEVEREQQEMQTTLEPFIRAGWVHFYAPDDGRFTTFIELLQSQSWHVVLLSGHGVFKPETQPAGFFVFENEEGSGELIAANTLAQVFEETKVQCVVVAACQSGQWLSLIMPIIQAGVPHVIGMREPLIDRAGSIFVRTLSVALAQRERVDVAVQQGRRAMMQLLLPNEVWRDTKGKPCLHDPGVGQWCLPMLLSRDPAQPLLDWNFCPQTRLPSLVGSQITLPEVFLGRRRELHTLGEALRIGTIQRLLIWGTGGVGKTALVARLAMALIQQGYRVLVYQAGEEAGFVSTLAQALELPETMGLERLLEFLVRERWLLWLDRLEWSQNPRNGVLTDESIQTSLDILIRKKKSDNLRIVLTSRWKIPSLDFEDYYLTCSSFNDYFRCIQHFGLPYSPSQAFFIYKKLHGNCHGLQLLKSMPVAVETRELIKQVEVVRRYLEAYQRRVF